MTGPMSKCASRWPLSAFSCSSPAAGGGAGACPRSRPASGRGACAPHRSDDRRPTGGMQPTGRPAGGWALRQPADGEGLGDPREGQERVLLVVAGRLHLLEDVAVQVVHVLLAVPAV